MMESLADAKLWVTYLFAGDPLGAALTCGADVPLDDRWLSIAESLE